MTDSRLWTMCKSSLSLFQTLVQERSCLAGVYSVSRMFRYDGRAVERIL